MPSTIAYTPLGPSLQSEGFSRDFSFATSEAIPVDLEAEETLDHRLLSSAQTGEHMLSETDETDEPGILDRPIEVGNSLFYRESSNETGNSVFYRRAVEVPSTDPVNLEEEGTSTLIHYTELDTATPTDDPSTLTALPTEPLPVITDVHRHATERQSPGDDPILESQRLELELEQIGIPPALHPALHPQTDHSAVVTPSVTVARRTSADRSSVASEDTLAAHSLVSSSTPAQETASEAGSDSFSLTEQPDYPESDQDTISVSSQDFPSGFMSTSSAGLHV